MFTPAASREFNAETIAAKSALIDTLTAAALFAPLPAGTVIIPPVPAWVGIRETYNYRAI